MHLSDMINRKSISYVQTGVVQIRPCILCFLIREELENRKGVVRQEDEKTLELGKYSGIVIIKLIYCTQKRQKRRGA